MKKAAIWLITAAALVLLGGIVFVSALYFSNFDFNELGYNKFKTETVEISEEFKDISLNFDTEDVKFSLSEDGKCRVVFYERENEKHTAAVIDNTLTVNKDHNKKWYEYISFFSFGTQKITVYLPKANYGALKVDGSTGNVSIKGVLAGEINIAVSTGRVDVDNTACKGNINVSVSTGRTEFKNSKCKNLNSSGSTGDITLENVICGGNINIKRSTGDIVFIGSDAGEISVKTSTGDVEGTLLSEKVFITKTDTGEVNVPETVTGGKCKIITDTGDIKISIE